MRARKSQQAVRVIVLLLLAALGAWASTTAVGAAVQPKSGKYKGATQQESVLKSERAIKFRVKGRQITLVEEPAVAKGFCVSPPTFIEEEGKTVKSRISAGGTFSFTRTFLGSRFDRIRGRFIDDSRIEGEAVYHFHSSATCEGGKTRTTFKAKR
jgi:hypothetical protein